MKQYLLSVCYPAGGAQPPPDALQKIMRDVVAVQKEMQAAGAWIFSGGLHSADTATVLRQQGGEIVTTDGPFIESKEQIGGITVLKADDLDAALAWGRKLARAIGVPIEVRPFMEGHG
ncbi:MAG: YciI family protein [Pseudomonadota bacterium]